MKRIFIFSYDPFITNVDSLFNFLNGSPDILNWRYPSMPGTVFLVSRLDVVGVGVAIHQHMAGLNYYVAEVSAHSIQGWGQQQIWDFLSNPPELPPQDTRRGLLPPSNAGTLPGL
jgi:hypothetical protein